MKENKESRTYEWSIFVRSIKSTNVGTLIVEASNGRYEGPPFARFTLPSGEISKIAIGKRYVLMIKEG